MGSVKAQSRFVFNQLITFVCRFRSRTQQSHRRSERWSRHSLVGVIS